jgi:uncharacterized membrane protein HdeD (DUF308 family)
MSLLRTHGWRLPLLAGGVLMALGGRMHPDADAEDSLVEELATMTADDRWVPGHLLIVAGTVLMVIALWAARSSDAWPRARQALTLAAVAFTAYAVETVFHAAAAADHDHLAAGELGPIALTHVVLSSFLYPISGAALVFLALTLVRTESGVRRLVPVLALVAGTLHLLSVPTTLLFPDAEASPMFAGAGIGMALWCIATALVGASRRQAAVAAPPAQSFLSRT